MEKLNIIPRNAANPMEEEKDAPPFRNLGTKTQDNLGERTQLTGKKPKMHNKPVIQYSTRSQKGIYQNVLSKSTSRNLVTAVNMIMTVDTIRHFSFCMHFHHMANV